MSCCMHLMKSIEHDWSVARHVDICTIEKGCKNQPGSWWAGYPLGSLESESDYSSQRFIERWGLHEPLSLGITTNGIRCAQWMGCENTGEKKHGLPWWHGMHIFFSKNPMWSENPWQLDRGRLKRFLPQLRAAGLRSINLSRVPQSTEEFKYVWHL